jgi:hypothetical protein
MLNDLECEQRVVHVFDHPVADPPWYFEMFDRQSGVLDATVESRTSKHWWLYILLSLSLLMMACTTLHRFQYRIEAPLCALAALSCLLAGWILAIAMLRRGLRLGILIWAWLIIGTIILGAFCLLLFTFVLG